jgi:hypothetical protein
LLAYEGGQHLTTFGKTLPYTEVYARAQTRPMMEQVYQRLFQVLKEQVVDLVMAFNYAGAPGVFGSWGHLRYQDEPLADAPKFRALVKAAQPAP